MAADAVTWLEIVEKGGVGAFAIVLLASCIKLVAVLLEHKKASEDERAALNKSNDEARVALVMKQSDALIEIATQRTKHDDKADS